MLSRTLKQINKLSFKSASNKTMLQSYQKQQGLLFASYHNSAMNEPITFYNFVTKDINNNRIDLHQMKGKVCLVAFMNTENEHCKEYLKQLSSFKLKLNGKPFELIVIPNHDLYSKRTLQLLNASTNSTQDRSVTGSFFNNDLTILKSTESPSGPVAACDYLTKYGSFKTIVEDFEKFVIDSEGKVSYRSGSDTVLEEVMEAIEGELAKLH